MSTFTDWNGPSGHAPARSDWRELINEYKSILEEYVKKVPGKDLSDNNFTNELKEKLDKLNVKYPLMPDYLMTKAAVDAALADYVKKETGKALSTNDFTDAFKTKLEGLDAVLAAGYVAKAEGKDLSTNDFTTVLKDKLNKLNVDTKTEDTYVMTKGDVDAVKTSIESDIKTNIYDDSRKGYHQALKPIKAPAFLAVDEKGWVFCLGMIEDNVSMGQVYVEYKNSASFKAIVSFVVTGSNGTLTVLTDNDNEDMNDLAFYLVSATDGDSNSHHYIGVTSKKWQSTGERPYISIPETQTFWVGGVNFIPTGTKDSYKKPQSEYNKDNYVWCTGNLGFNYIEATSTADRIPIGGIIGWGYKDAEAMPEGVTLPKGYDWCDYGEFEEADYPKLAEIYPDLHRPKADYMIVRVN